jgi:hypothetical protein
MTSYLRQLLADMREKEAAVTAHFALYDPSTPRSVPGFADLHEYNIRTTRLVQERDMAVVVFADMAGRMMEERTLVEKKVRR